MMQKLFFELFNAKDEDDLAIIIENHSSIFADENWKALGDNKSNYGLVNNQQSNPISALI